MLLNLLGSFAFTGRMGEGIRNPEDGRSRLQLLLLLTAIFARENLGIVPGNLRFLNFSGMEAVDSPFYGGTIWGNFP